ATSFRGDIRFGTISLYPSASGDVQLLANNDILVAGDLALSDIDPAELGSVQHPSASFEEFASRLQTSQRVFGTTPVHLSDPVPARFVARNGDINFVAPGSLVFIAKPAEFTAGRDIIGLNASIQNLHADDFSLVEAGRDLAYLPLRDLRGNIIP